MNFRNLVLIGMLIFVCLIFLISFIYIVKIWFLNKKTATFNLPNLERKEEKKYEVKKKSLPKVKTTKDSIIEVDTEYSTNKEDILEIFEKQLDATPKVRLKKLPKIAEDTPKEEVVSNENIVKDDFDNMLEDI